MQQTIQDFNPDHKEGPVAKAIENQTAKLPSDVFLWGAIGAIVGAAALQMMGRKQSSGFVGLWAPTILIFGLYNKLVKLAGSEGSTVTAAGTRKKAQLH